MYVNMSQLVSNGHVCRRLSNGMRLLLGVLMYVNISQLVCRLSNGMRLLLGVLMYLNISQLVSNGGHDCIIKSRGRYNKLVGGGGGPHLILVCRTSMHSNAVATVDDLHSTS